MATYLSNELAGTIDGKTLTPVLGTRPRGSVVNGRIKRFRATVTLNGQLSGDLIYLFNLPLGASVVLGNIVNSVSLGTTTVGVGTLANPVKYRGQSAGLTAVNTPSFFAAAAASADENAAEEPVYATLGTAALPVSGTMVIDVLVSLPT